MVNSLVEVTADTGEKPTVTTPMRAFPLSPKRDDYTGTPPTGWKEYSPRDKSFTVWVPEKPERQEDKERTVIVAKTQRIRVNAVVGKMTGGVTYQAESVVLPGALVRGQRSQMLTLAHDLLAGEVKGKLSEVKEGRQEPVVGDGVPERIGRRGHPMPVDRRRGADLHHAGGRERGCGHGARGGDDPLLLPRTAAPGGDDAGPGRSDPGRRRRLRPRPESKPNATSKPTAPTSPAKVVPRGKEPTILAGAFDPQFKDAAPEGALLVGFELGFGKWGNWDMIRTVRPVLSGLPDGESFGRDTSRDPAGKTTATLKAKDGYAVGAVTVVHVDWTVSTGCR